jgi:pimeloyl-ACP methyl ester carboxylesterase
VRNAAVTEQPTWVLLHGTPLTPQVWQAVAEQLGRAGAVRCPAVTPRGADRSPPALARRVLAEVPGELDVVGHSFGGQVALDVALLEPERVRSLTMICSRDTPFPPFAAAARTLRSGAPVDIPAALERWFRPNERAAGGPVVDYARGCLETADRDAWADALQAIAEYDRADQVGQLRMPVRLVAAEHDTVSTPRAMAELRDRVVTARLRVLPGAAHLSMFARPAELAALTLAAAGR